jgi:prepilin-type N-terminal cleavage/methylation domain-containing protein
MKWSECPIGPNAGGAGLQECQAVCYAEQTRPIASPRARGYTLVEVLITFAIMLVLSSLILVGLTGLVRNARVQGERQALRSMGMGVEQFTRTFGFVPPLVDDSSPAGAIELLSATNTFRARIKGSQLGEAGPVQFLRYEVSNPRGQRYSELTLPYFLAGALGQTVDGAAGVGLTRPLIDGSFSRRGEPIEPLYVDTANPERLKRRSGTQPVVSDVNEQLAFTDRWGTEIRFYSWLPTFHQPVEAPLFHPDASDSRLMCDGRIRSSEVRNRPAAAGQWSCDVRFNPAARSARWAIVSAGPDKRIDDVETDAPVNMDNIVILEGAQ